MGKSNQITPEDLILSVEQRFVHIHDAAKYESVEVCCERIQKAIATVSVFYDKSDDNPRIQPWNKSHVEEAMKILVEGQHLISQIEGLESKFPQPIKEVKRG